MKNALAVQVLQPSGDIQRQTDPDTPRQVQITVQQLLQVTSIYILKRGTTKDSEDANIGNDYSGAEQAV